jgi:hypothetical protein
MARARDGRWIAWSGFAGGVWLMLAAGLSTFSRWNAPAEGQLARAEFVELGLWLGAGIAVAVPGFVWLLGSAARMFAPAGRAPARGGPGAARDGGRNDWWRSRAMPQMVYIREIHPHSFLVLTTSGESFCLRDFSAKSGPVLELARQSPDRGASQIRELARRGGNHLIDVPERKIDDYDYWHEQTAAMNARFLGLLPTPAVPWLQWLRDHVAQVVIAVAVAVLSAVVLAWLGLGK